MFSSANRFRNLLVGLILIVLAGITLTGCASNKTKSTLDVVRERGKLIVGARFDTAPVGYLNDSGELVGIDIEIAKYVAQQLGVEIEFKEVTADTRIPELVNGNVDMLAAGTVITREREDVVDFTIPIRCAYSRFLVKRDSGIEDIDNMAGKTVAVIQGTPYGEELLVVQPEAKILTLQEYPQALLALQQGQADVIFSGEEILFGLLKLDPNNVIVGDPNQFPYYCAALATRENDSDWNDFLSGTLIDMWYSGAYEQAHIKIFGFPPDPHFVMPTWKL